MTSKTKNEIEIRQTSNGFSSGKLYVGDTSEEIECVSIFDKETYNFYLCPQIERNDIAVEIGEKRKAVIESLKNLDSVIVSDKEISGNEKDVIYINAGEGSRGSHRSCKELGGLFKFISAKKNNIKYELNFMRFFVDGTANGFNRVNCILKSLQFDRCVGITCNRTVKGDCDICYPLCFCSHTDDELEKLLDTRAGQSFCFNPKIEFDDDAEKIAEEFVRFINISDAYGKNYIVKKELLSKDIDNRYILKLNRNSECLELYEKVDIQTLFCSYPIRGDFDASGYVMYILKKEIPCVFGGGGRTRTPSGLFRIEKVSRSEYISPYHPLYKEVKFFGYLTLFEDYFIHSDMYLMDATSDNFRQKESISRQDKHTSGCIRVTQDELEWLIENIPAGTTVEL